MPFLGMHGSAHPAPPPGELAGRSPDWEGVPRRMIQETKVRYTKDQRLEIGQLIYEGKLTRYQAAERYGVSEATARDYMRLYRDVNSLPPKGRGGDPQQRENPMMNLYAMSRHELIDEVVRARLAEAKLREEMTWQEHDLHDIQDMRK